MHDGLTVLGLDCVDVPSVHGGRFIYDSGGCGRALWLHPPNLLDRCYHAGNHPVNKPVSTDFTGDYGVNFDW